MGKYHGLCQEYYKSGQLKVKCNFINDYKNGLYQEYNKLGQLVEQCNYIYDKING